VTIAHPKKIRLGDSNHGNTGRGKGGNLGSCRPVALLRPIPTEESLGLSMRGENPHFRNLRRGKSQLKGKRFSVKGDPRKKKIPFEERETFSGNHPTAGEMWGERPTVRKRTYNRITGPTVDKM